MTGVFVTIGIDVSSRRLDCYCSSTGEMRSLDNTEEGRAAISAFAAETKADLVAFEATGGYEKPLGGFLRESGIAFACVNPANVRHYAKARGTRAKTDAIDARMIAEFACVTRPEADKGENCERLVALVRRRKQLIAHKGSEERRLKQSAFGDIKECIERCIHFLKTEIEAVDQAIQAAVKARAPLKEKYAVLNSIKGCGHVAASSMLAHMPELGRLDHRKITALAGLAPYSRDSGAFKGKRFISGGRAEVRKDLYMAVLSAIRYNADFKTVYERLIAAGKPAKVAITACMRKFLILANALIRDNRLWSEYYAAQPK